MAIIKILTQLDNLSDIINNPNPDRPVANAIGGFVRKVCDGQSNNPVGGLPVIFDAINAVCTPYWNNQNYSPPSLDVPFTGGQCAGSRYTLRGTFVVSCGANAGQTREWRSAGGLAIGPITGVVPGGNGWRVAHAGTASVETLDDLANVGINRVPRPGVECSQVVNPNSTAAVAPRITLITPFGGDPDNCGNPDGVPVPGPNPAPDPGPLPPGTGPTIDIRGNPIIVLPPTIEIAPDVSIDLSPGEVNIGGGAGGGPAVEPVGGDAIAGEGSGTGGGDNDFGDPPDGERWAGCCVTITAAPLSAGSIPQAEPQSIYPRTIGNVRLKFAGSGGGAEYDTPIVNRQRTTCVWEPVRGLNPTGVRINLLPGYSYTFRPYSVPLEQ